MVKVTTDLLKDLGTELHDALIELVGQGGRLPRPTDLSRQWDLDQTLCVRTCSALRNQDPLRVLHQLSSTGSLRTILEAGRERGVGTTICQRAESAIERLEEAITSLGGKKSNLDTLIGSRLVEAREKIEATSKQSIFRGMSNLLGLQSDAVATAYYVYPSDDDPEHCDELAIYGSEKMRRLRPELTTLVGGRVLAGEPASELHRAMEVLHGGELDRSGLSVAIKRFSTDPFPEIEVMVAGKRLLYTLPGEDSGDTGELTMFFASIDRHASLRYRRHDVRSAPFIFVPRNPSKEMLLDVFVHQDVWRGVAPRLSIGRGQNLLEPDAEASLGIDELDFCESLQTIGENPRSIDFKPIPRYAEMLHHVRQSAGLEAGEFRLFRLQVKYPVIALAYGIHFGLPERPVAPFYGSTGRA